jgi:hypothetical protein
MAASPALPVRLNLSALVAFVLGCDGVSAQQPQARLALLIGDQAYNAVVGPLKNPHNDIALIGAALEKLGSRQASFRTRTTAPSTSPSNAIFKACAERRAGTISFVYYSGHAAADPRGNRAPELRAVPCAVRADA